MPSITPLSLTLVTSRRATADSEKGNIRLGKCKQNANLASLFGLGGIVNLTSVT